MKSAIIAALSLLGFSMVLVANPPTPAPSEINIEVSSAKRMHTVAQGKAFTDIRIALRYRGEALANANAIQTTVTTASDEAGNPLQAGDAFHDSDGTFKRLKKPFGQAAVPNEFELKLAFEGPEKTQSVKALSGNIQLLMPDKDPASIVTASFEKDADQPLKHPALQAAGVEITLLKPTGISTGKGKRNGVVYEQYDLSYQIKDPNQKVVEVEVFDAAGQKLKAIHGTTIEEPEKKTKALHLDALPPKDAMVKIYLVTEKATVTVPFDFKDVVLGR